jgi:microcystin-dependent protein
MSITPGVIIMWYGVPSKIPQDWKVCDGTNGTPDLRGKFILGWNPENNRSFIKNQVETPNFIGQEGGSDTHNLTINEIPRHNHSYTEGGGYRVCNGSDSHIGDNPFDRLWFTDTEPNGGDQPHNNMPPYNVLLYIMKK